VIPLIYEDDDAATRLATLALTVENLVAALMAGDAEARAWTEAAPANMSGMASVWPAGVVPTRLFASG
jgi:hypothetical protein